MKDGCSCIQTQAICTHIYADASEIHRVTLLKLRSTEWSACLNFQIEFFYWGLPVIGEGKHVFLMGCSCFAFQPMRHIWGLVLFWWVIFLFCSVLKYCFKVSKRHMNFWDRDNMWGRKRKQLKKLNPKHLRLKRFFFPCIKCIVMEPIFPIGECI